MPYRRRQLVVSALAANALRPVNGPAGALSIPSMFAGWIVSELTPHFLAGTALDTAVELARRGPRPRLLLGLANVVALAYALEQSRSSHLTVESALAEGLGETYRSQRHEHPHVPPPLRQLAWPFRVALRDVEVVRDVPYAPQFGRRGLVDIYKPAGDVTGAPAILQVHGGAWTIGAKERQAIPLMTHLAARGWVCFAINYRLSPRNAWPAHLVDVKRAIAWVRRHGEEYGADPAFVAITGGSAGGHLAALAALTPNDPEYQPGFEGADTSVQAAVPFYGVYDLAATSGAKALLRMRDQFLGPRVFFEDPRQNLEPFEKASPLLRVREDAPPFYVIHGVNDTLAPVAQARAFVEALRTVSRNPVAYSELVGTQHAFDIFPSIRSQHAVRGVDRFLHWAHASWQRERRSRAPAARAPGEGPGPPGALSERGAGVLHRHRPRPPRA